MTYYHGGKKRIGKEIASILSQFITDDIVGYCEPFCGMLGVYKHILLRNNNIQYLAGDTNSSVIEMWKSLQDGWEPPVDSITKDEWEELKHDHNPSAIRGYVGHLYDFRGIFFLNYYNRKEKEIQRNRKSVMEIADITGNVEFNCGEYSQYSKLNNFLIYCDPPYSKCNRYYTEDGGKRKVIKFDSLLFWKWVKLMSKNNTLIISEYSCPLDESEYTILLDKGKEKLFLIKNRSK